MRWGKMTIHRQDLNLAFEQQVFSMAKILSLSNFFGPVGYTKHVRMCKGGWWGGVSLGGVARGSKVVKIRRFVSLFGGVSLPPTMATCLAQCRGAWSL